MKTGSPYAKIIPGSSGTTDIVFSHANIPPGTFNLERTGARINSKILLNTHNNDCFQRGIPQIADSIETAAPWLAARVKDLGGSTLRIIGISAGAQSAIVYGHLLGADAVIAVSPEIHLGHPDYRSYQWNPEKIFHPRWRDAAPLLPLLGARLSVSFAAWDVSDFRHLHTVLQTPEVKVTLVPDMHGGERLLDWARITAAPGAVDLSAMTLSGTYDWRLDLAEIWRGVLGYEAIGKDDTLADQVFGALMTADPDNPGLVYRAAIQKALLGDYVRAAMLWRRCAAPMATTPLPLLTRFTEYRDILDAGRFARLQDFAFSAAAETLPAPARSHMNLLGAW